MYVLTCENCSDTIELAENLTECKCGLICGEIVKERLPDQREICRAKISGGILEVE